jgi:hypothetical protein
MVWTAASRGERRAAVVGMAALDVMTHPIVERALALFGFALAGLIWYVGFPGWSLFWAFCALWIWLRAGR